MNELSYLIYFADVLPNFASLLGTLSLVFCVLSAIAAVCSFFESNNSANEDESNAFLFKISKVSSWIFVAFLMVGLFTVFVPERETFYLIAGSEMGEAVANSERGQKTLDKLGLVIDTKLDEMINGDEE